MKLTYLLPLLLLAGCSPQTDAPAGPVDPDVNLPTSAKIDKIKNDPNIPDGLKQIQIDTLERQAGTKR